jgi:hypothetical protein
VGRRLVRDESGIALVLALISMMVLSSLTAAVLFSTTVNHRNALRSSEGDRAFALAEDGLADAEGRLYTAVSGGCTSACVPASSFSQDGGTVSYSGSLSGSTWTLSGTGAIDGLSRVVTAQANVPPPQVIPDPTIWNYLYSNSTTSCLTLQGGSTINVPLYTQGPVCITGGAHFTGSDLEINSSLTIGGGSNIGTSSQPITKLDIAGTCTQLNTGLPNPVCDGHTGLIHASTVGNAVSPTLTMPTTNFATTYATQAAASKTGCPAGLFDNDGTLNNSLSATNLTNALFPVIYYPAPASYDCHVGTGELKWTQNAGSSNGTLLVNGTFIFDGSLNLGSTNGGQKVTYVGGGTLYFTGTVFVDGGAALCGGPSGCTGWNPGGYIPAQTNQCSGCNVLTLIAGCWANSTGSSIATDCADLSGGTTTQAGIMAANKPGGYYLSGGSSDQGPVIADTINVQGGTNISTMMPFHTLPSGTPTDTRSVPSTPQAPTNWSG